MGVEAGIFWLAVRVEFAGDAAVRGAGEAKSRRWGTGFQRGSEGCEQENVWEAVAARGRRADFRLSTTAGGSGKNCGDWTRQQFRGGERRVLSQPGGTDRVSRQTSRGLPHVAHLSRGRGGDPRVPGL